MEEVFNMSSDRLLNDDDGVFCRSSERNLLHVTLLVPRILIGGSQIFGKFGYP